MMKLNINTNHPASCSPSDLEQFRALVVLGDEVVSVGLTDRISSSFRLAWALDGPKMVAVAALKRPNPHYHKSVFEKSETSEHYVDWEAELGWIYVQEKYRKKGIARKLVNALFVEELNRTVFATTRVLNDPIIPLLKEFGFVQEGKAYASKKGDHKLILHVKRA